MTAFYGNYKEWGKHFIRSPTYTNLHTHRHNLTHSHTRACTHILTHTHTHKHKHTNTQTHKHTLAQITKLYKLLKTRKTR